MSPNVETNAPATGFNQYPFYGDGTSERLFDNGLCLPSGSNLKQNDLDRVVAGIRLCFK